MKPTSTEAHVYTRRHQGAKVEHFDFSNVIYHKFSHGAVSYTLKGEKVNVMLEFKIIDGVQGIIIITPVPIVAKLWPFNALH